MKKNLRTLLMVTLLASVSLGAAAQKFNKDKSPLPKWISDHGYWVIESNVKTPKTSSIFFYNNSNTLVYSEKVEGVKLNVKRRKTLMKLKAVLDESLIAWEKTHQPKSEQLVAAIFKSNK